MHREASRSCASPRRAVGRVHAHDGTSAPRTASAARSASAAPASRYWRVGERGRVAGTVLDDDLESVGDQPACTASGVSATRVSPARDSAGTATRARHGLVLSVGDRAALEASPARGVRVSTATSQLGCRGGLESGHAHPHRPDPGRGLHRAVHGRARRLRRERRAPDDRPRPALLAVGSAVGRERLRAHVRRIPAAWAAGPRTCSARSASSSSASRSSRARASPAGLRRTDTWLTTARAVQGFGGAILSPATLTIIVTTFSGPKLARSIGMWSSVAGAGGATGALLGGILVTGALVAMGAVHQRAHRRCVRGRWRSRGSPSTDAPADARPLDVLGAVLVTAGLSAAVYGIVNTTTYAWGSSRTVITLAHRRAVLLVAFSIVETRLVAIPLVPMRFFRARAASGANARDAAHRRRLLLDVVLPHAVHAGRPRVLGAQDRAGIPPAVLRDHHRRADLEPAHVEGRGVADRDRRHRVSPRWASSCSPELDGRSVELRDRDHAAGLRRRASRSASCSARSPPPPRRRSRAQDAGLASGILSTSRQVGGSLGLAVLATVATSHAVSPGRPAALAGHPPRSTRPRRSRRSPRASTSPSAGPRASRSSRCSPRVLLRGVFPVRQASPQAAPAPAHRRLTPRRGARRLAAPRAPAGRSRSRASSTQASSAGSR